MTEMTGSRRYVLADDVVLQVAGEEVLLVKLAAEDMFALNHTGADIVRRLAAGVSHAALVDDLVAAYAANRSAVERDVSALLDELIVRGLLEVSDEQP